jgi:hypothetical protein
LEEKDHISLAGHVRKEGLGGSFGLWKKDIADLHVYMLL